MYDAAQDLITSRAARGSADVAEWLKRFQGQEGWPAKMCALRSAHFVFTGQRFWQSTWAADLSAGVGLALRGAGYVCRVTDF